MGKLYDRMKADLELRGYSPRTGESYLSFARRFVEHYMRPAEELGELEIRCFLLHQVRVREVGPATIKMYVAALKFLYEVTLSSPEATRSLAWPKVPKPLPDVLSLEEVMRVLEAVGSLVYRAVLTTAYATGMRISETCRLQASDIDRERGVIHVRKGKGGKDRYVMAGDELIACLRDYWRKTQPPGPYLFPGRRNREEPMSRASVRRALSQATAATGIQKPVTLHGLRHAFATHMLEAGVDLRTLQYLMGHESIGTTARYTRVSARHVARTPSPLDLMKRESAHADDGDRSVTTKGPATHGKARVQKRTGKAAKPNAPRPGRKRISKRKRVAAKGANAALRKVTRKKTKRK
jgi:integrase/recombinase XerD